VTLKLTAVKLYFFLAYSPVAAWIPIQHVLQTIVGISLAYATLIQCFEHMSGAYMNPAITVAMATARHLSVVKAIMYIVAQMTGSFCAVALCFG